MKCIIADAGPIISLCKIDQLGLLLQLFSPCIITQVVYDEITAGNDVAVDCLKQAIDNKNIAIENAKTISNKIVNVLDQGEATSISLALEKGNCALLIDEAQGRHVARHLKIPFLGLAGLFILAKEKQLINAVIPLLLAIRKNNYWMSDKFIQSIAIKVKENWKKE